MEFHPCPKPVKTEKKKRHYIKPGKKVNEWEAAKKELKIAFAEVGITHDELCMYLMSNEKYAEKAKNFRPGYFLTWAHGDKRDNLVGNELYSLVVLAGIDSHNFVEKMPRLEMRAIVEEIIAKRKVQPVTYYH